MNIKIFYQKDFRRLLARFGVASDAVAHADGGGLVARDESVKEGLGT